MELSEFKMKQEREGKISEYIVKVTYGKEKLEACIQKLMKSMSQKDEVHEEV